MKKDKYTYKQEGTYWIVYINEKPIYKFIKKQQAIDYCNKLKRESTKEDK